MAQQASKLLNVIWPGSGSVVSSAAAFSGTYAIGNAAIAYYINEQDIEGVKQKFEKNKKTKE